MSSAKEFQESLNQIKASKGQHLNAHQQALLNWSKNVDKRYAWVVLAALFTLNSFVLGPNRCYGLVYAVIVEQEVYTREQAVWPTSMLVVVENVLGPVVSIIAMYISFRQCLFIGSVLCVLGLAPATWSYSLLADVFIIGVVQGLGWAFVVMPLMEIINSYFLRYRNLALGIALCGGTVSVFLWLPLTEYMLATYHWRYTYLFLGGLATINLFLVPLFRDNPQPEVGNSSSKEQDKNTLRRLSNRALSFQGSRRQSSIDISKANLSRLSMISNYPFDSRICLQHQMSRSISAGGQQPKSTREGDQSNSSLPVADSQSKAETLDEFKSSKQSQVNIPSTSFGTKNITAIFLEPAFHLIWFTELVYFWVLCLYCLIMVDFGLDQGLSKDDAGSLINMWAIGEIVGRMALSALADLHLISNKNTAVLVLSLLAACLFAITSTTGLIPVSILTIVISSFTSLVYILLNGLIVDYLGEKQITLVYGLASFVCGLSMVFQPMAVGFFRDGLGSYNLLMRSMGASCLISAFLWILEPAFTKLCRSERSNSNDQVSNSA